VNCQEFVEQITPAVDQRLTVAERERFLSHAAACRPCRVLLEAEQGVVSLVHSRLPQVAAPPQLLSRIMRDIDAEADGARLGFIGSLRAFVQSMYFRPAVGFGLAAVGLLFVLTRPSGNPAAPSLANEQRAPSAPIVKAASDADIVRQSVKHYDGVLKGTVSPQIVSNMPDRVKSYFAGRAAFPVLVPNMKDLTLVGGVMDDAYGDQMAHVYYRHGNDTIAMTQAATASVMRGTGLSLSDSARAELGRKGWYREVTPDGRTVLLWVRGGTVCAAVSQRENDPFLTRLIESLSDSTAW
jgi:anti-sigma factor (TIGR02949 family)